MKPLLLIITLLNIFLVLYNYYCFRKAEIKFKIYKSQTGKLFAWLSETTHLIPLNLFMAGVNFLIFVLEVIK